MPQGMPPYRSGNPGYEMDPLTPTDTGEKNHLPDVDYKKGKMTGTLFLAVCACAIGSSFTFGYNIGVINQPKDVVQKWMIGQIYGNDTYKPNVDEKRYVDELWGWIVSTYCIGGLLGGVISGFMADKFGRKGGMLLNNVICFVAAILLGCAKFTNNWYMLIVGRLVVGFNAGLNTAFAPLYLTEISPVNLRGALGSVHQLMVTISILVSMLIGLPNIFGNERLWPLLFALTAAPGVFQMITLPFCPESPKHLLINKHQNERAEKALIKLRKSPDVRAEMDRMEAEAAQAKNAPKVKLTDMFKFPLRWPLLIAVMMMFSQQLSGINVAMYYSTEIFKAAGLTKETATGATIGMGIINVIMTIVSTAMVDRFGRRTLHLVGMIGMWIFSILLVVCLSYTPKKEEVAIKEVVENASSTLVAEVAEPEGSITAAYFAIVFVFLFVISFATGPGSIPWFYVSETFRQGPRAHANSIAVVANWAANFIVAMAFLPLLNATKQFSFLVFTGFLTIFIVFTYFFVPETKGKTVEEIVSEFEKGSKYQH